MWRAALLSVSGRTLRSDVVHVFLNVGALHRRSVAASGNFIHYMSFSMEYSTLRAIIQDEMYTCKVREQGIRVTSLAESLACLPEEPSSEKKDWSRMEHKRSIENRIKKRVKEKYFKGKFYDLMDEVIQDKNTLQDAYDIIRLDSNVDLSSERDDLCFMALANELASGTLDVKANTFTILARSGSKEYLVLPNLRLKVIQEAIRVTLEVVYRPHFSKISHGCRSGRGHRSALRYISHGMGSPDWWFTLHMNKEADVRIIAKLITLMEEKIEDVRLFSFIHSMLEAKVLNLKFGGFPKGQGLPQEGVLSPILMNIYLDTFDHELFRIFLRYECLGEETCNPIDGKHSKLRNWFRRQMKDHNDGPEEDLNLRIHACRFMDEIFIAVKGPKNIACSLKDEVQRYLIDSLYIEVDDQMDILAADSSDHGLQFLGMVIRVRSAESERVRAVHKLKGKVQSFALQKQNIWDALTVRIGKKWLAYGLKRLKESEIRQLGLSTPILDQISHFRKEGMKTDHWFKSLFKIWLQDVNAKIESNEDIVLSKYIAEPALPQDLTESFHNFQKQVEEYVSLETDSILQLLSDSSINAKCRSTNSKSIKIEAPTSFIIKCLRRYGVINVEGYPRCIYDLLLQDDILIVHWFSGLVRRWLKWYSDFDNFQDVKIMMVEYVRKSCIRTLATKHRMLESDVERKFESELDGIPLIEELESTATDMATSSHYVDDDQALMYGISYSGLCVLSLARVKVPSRPLCCSVMGCLVDSPSIYTLHVNERQRFPGWNTGFSSAIYFGLKERRIALCKQHVRDLYLGLVSLQSIDFGAFSRWDIMRLSDDWYEGRVSSSVVKSFLMNGSRRIVGYQESNNYDSMEDWKSRKESKSQISCTSRREL